MQQTPQPYLMPLRVFLFRQHGEVACKARAIGLNLLSGLLPLAAELRMSHTSEIVRPAGDMEGIVHHRGERRSAAMAACSPRRCKRARVFRNWLRRKRSSRPWCRCTAGCWRINRKETLEVMELSSNVLMLSTRATTGSSSAKRSTGSGYRCSDSISSVAETSVRLLSVTVT